MASLIFCNAHLIRTLRTAMVPRYDPSASFRQAVRPAAPRRTARQRSEQATHRITLTLVVIIVLFVVLFIPSELVNFFVHLAVQTRYKTEIFNVAIAVGNLLQTINFAVNFVLYSAVNTHFQYTICRTFGCKRCRSSDGRDASGRRRDLMAFEAAVRTNGEMVRFRRGRCVESDRAIAMTTAAAFRHVQPPSLAHSQRTPSPTVAVSYV